MVWSRLGKVKHGNADEEYGLSSQCDYREKRNRRLSRRRFSTYIRRVYADTSEDIGKNLDG
jgi:hypothetical protein